jgi:hypothetical protein
VLEVGPASISKKGFLAHELFLVSAKRKESVPLKIGEIVKELRYIAQECKRAATESSDEELSEFLLETSVILSSFADTLAEYNQ